MNEKTEQPSPQRLREALEEGNVARSRTLAAAGAALGGLVALGASAPAAALVLQTYAQRALADAGANATPANVATARAAWALASACAPTLLGTLLGALAGAGFQVGFLLRPQALCPALEKLSPSQGFARVFSAKNLVEVLKAAIVVSLVLWLAWSAVRHNARVVGRLPLVGPLPALQAGFFVARDAALKALAVALLVGLADYLLERRSRLKGLMMTREELKQEHKQAEGDPHHKAKRKAAHRALLNGTASRGVQRANVVVVNPTHVAVALRYEPKEAAAPTIVAKGVDAEAARIRWLARRFSVPMVRDVPLARALVRYDLGDEIPEELYQAAAAVLRQVYETGATPPVCQRSTP